MERPNDRFEGLCSVLERTSQDTKPEVYTTFRAEGASEKGSIALSDICPYECDEDHCRKYDCGSNCWDMNF